MDLSWQTGLHRYRRYFVDIGQFYRQKKVRVYTEIVLSILTTAFFLFFAIKPTLVTITGLIKEIKDKKIVTQKLEEKINALKIAQQEYLSVQPELYLVDEALPKDSQISLLVKQIEFLSARAGVILEGVQYSSVNLKDRGSSSKPEEVEFKIVVGGDYQSLNRFLLSLNKLRRIIQLEGFAFKAKKLGEGLALSLTAKSFFEKEGK